MEIKQLKNSAQLFLVLLCLFFSSPSGANVEQPSNFATKNDYFSVYFIDVGQGDSALIETNNKHYILIDAGFAPQVLTILNNKKINTLSSIILSHPHQDHYGGLNVIINNISVESFISSSYESSSGSYANLVDLIDSRNIIRHQYYGGKSITYDNLTIIFFNPPAGRQISSSPENNNSLVFKVTNKSGISVLFLGDIQKEGIQDMLLRYPGFINSSIVKISHHGSHNGTNLALLNEVKPTKAILSVGRNSYGHPSPQVIKLLESKHIKTYRTDLNGTIKLFVNGSQFSILPSK